MSNIHSCFGGVSEPIEAHPPQGHEIYLESTWQVFGIFDEIEGYTGVGKLVRDKIEDFLALTLEHETAHARLQRN
jgi:hypothetical protein